MINWEKVCILIKENGKITEKLIKTFPSPYNKIKCSKTAKILGHELNTNSKNEKRGK